MIRSHKIAFLIVYMGKWPWYFPYFLHSCKYNLSIDFFILTDNKTRLNRIPPNVYLVDYSIPRFNEEASNRLGFKIEIFRGYKLCDFKPAYGFIFQNIIKDYDFWGYCDIDLIFGDIRNFMTNNLLEEYDVISARHDYLAGAFSLYRNNLHINQLFTTSKDYKRVFKDSRNFCFDETNYAFEQFAEGVPYYKIETEVESMTHVVRRLQGEKRLKAYFDFQVLEGLPGDILWNKGRLTYKNMLEIMYYHLVIFKTIYSENNEPDMLLPERFKIEKEKIHYE